MKKILVTGGTTFVSKYAAEYFVNMGYEVYVLNRNTKSQVRGVKLIEDDRHNLNGILKNLSFDVVADITAYNEKDIIDFVKELGSYGQYIMISSSAVYPEYGVQPFLEESEKAANIFWGTYGTDKIVAEKALLERVKDAYILRPPYLYGPMNNVYREAFVFDCALADRKFYLPKDGDMKLQFFHVKDLCRLMEVIIKEKPEEHILNVGNAEAVSIKEWVGAGPVGVEAAVVVDIATGAQPPGVAGVVRERGAGPLSGGATVAVGNPQGGRNGQGGALRVGIGVGLPQLGEGQGKDGPLQGAHRVVAVAGGVADFGRTDEGADVGVQHVFVGAVKPAIQVAAGVGVHIAVVPHPVIIGVLADHQGPPSPIEAAFVVMFGNIEVNQRAVFFQLDNTAGCFVAQGGCGH